MVARNTRIGSNRSSETPSKVWGLLIPGYAAWRWRQTERAGVLFGTFAGSILVAAFAWGSLPGWLMLSFAFVVHVVAAADYLRQCAFPGFGRWVPPISASLLLGMGCYAPAFAAATVFAWPVSPSEGTAERYLVNLWAYKNQPPSSGEWVWFRSPGTNTLDVGRLVAPGGWSVECSSSGIQVGNITLDWLAPPEGGRSATFSMTVPEDQMLVMPTRAAAGEPSSRNLRIVPRTHLIGRPWACISPIWSRRIL